MTSVNPIGKTTGSPDQIRAFVRQTASQGADLIKIFVSSSVRDGGRQTMTDAQVEAACDEARKLGKRTWVHAHPESTSYQRPLQWAGTLCC